MAYILEREGVRRTKCAASNCDRMIFAGGQGALCRDCDTLMAKFIRDRIEAFVSRGYDRMAIDAGWTEQETYGCLIGYVNKYGLCDYTWGGELIVINSRVATINYENGTARIVSRALLLSMPAPHLEPPASPRNDYPRWLWRP